jgi:hypothetical protein
MLKAAARIRNKGMEELEPMSRWKRAVLAACLAMLLPSLAAAADNAPVTLRVDANHNRGAISPDVYGVAWAGPAALSDLNCPLNRQGGNSTSRYNWQLNADNRGADWYFESLAYSSDVPGEGGDTFISDSRAAGAQAMLTVPTLGWVAKLGANRGRLSSFSIAKYGPQSGSDWQWFPDAGNGYRANGQPITGNDPADASVPADSLFQQAWVRRLVGRWGAAANGGLRYYILDNEPSIWHATHRDVHPAGATMEEVRDKILDYAARIKDVDRGAQVVGPEEWGWSGYFYSGADQQYGPAHGWTSFPDRDAHGGWDYAPWLLDQLRQNDASSGRRLLDVFSLHYYPQGGEFSDDTSEAMQLRRNRSTRSLWDPNYVDESWIGDRVFLIRRMKGWVNTYYPKTKVAITEYNWGAEGHINGATAQADVLGIFGREGLDLGTRWTTPDPSTPTYQAFKMYRNYDGHKSAFGETSVSAVVPDPDWVSSFAALRAADGALTVMMINKYLTGNTPATINLANFPPGVKTQVWQLTSANTISRLADLNITRGSIRATLPAQSVTLFVVPPLRVNAGGPQYASPGGTFGADAYYTGGAPKSYASRPIDGTTSDPLYLTVRSGSSFSYSLPTENGAFTVKLHFAECEYAAAGQRKINVSLNGASVLSNFDIFTAAGGGNRAVVKSFPVTVTAGTLNVSFASAIAGGNAVLSGIEVTPR